jgi:hypothetical protein
MGRGNWRPSSEYKASDFLHFDIPMISYSDHLAEFGEGSDRTHPGELEERTRDNFHHFMSSLRSVLPNSFYEEDRFDREAHIIASNALCFVLFKEEDTYYGVAIVSRDDLYEYGDDGHKLEPLAVAYVERHAGKILDKLARLYPGSASYPTGAWTSAPYTPPKETNERRKRDRRLRLGESGAGKTL